MRKRHLCESSRHRSGLAPESERVVIRGLRLELGLPSLLELCPKRINTAFVESLEARECDEVAKKVDDRAQTKLRGFVAKHEQCNRLLRHEMQPPKRQTPAKV